MIFIYGQNHFQLFLLQLSLVKIEPVVTLLDERENEGLSSMMTSNYATGSAAAANVGGQKKFGQGMVKGDPHQGRKQLIGKCFTFLVTLE